MNNQKITVVLPIYRVEKYINRCIKSVVNQTYKNLEIILVDDGSPDNCPDICNKWAEKDHRIKVIHKKNEGLGMARNTGIDNATGDYICFFDSDDFIELDAIEKIYNVANSEKSDIVIFGFKNIDSNGNINSSKIPYSKKETYTDKEVQKYFLRNLINSEDDNVNLKNLYMSAWTAMYSLKLIRENNWHFVSEKEIISEDVYSLLELYKYVKKVSVVSMALYNYCQNEESLTHTYQKNRYKKIKYFYERCQEVCDKQGYTKEIKQKLAYPYISNTIAALKMIAESEYSKKLDEFKKIILDPHLQKVLLDIDMNKENGIRKIFLNLLKRKMYRLIYILVKLQNRIK